MCETEEYECFIYEQNIEDPDRSMKWVEKFPCLRTCTKIRDRMKLLLDYVRAEELNAFKALLKVR
jgi:hypothetical protein